MGITLCQCKQCGRIFQSYNQALCPPCMDDRERSYIAVRDYVYMHPEAILIDIAKNTKVDEGLILEFLKEERLSINDNEQMLLCEKCGKPIAKGKYCDKCKEFFEQILHDLSDRKRAEEQIEPKKSPNTDAYSKGRYRMHVELSKK